MKKFSFHTQFVPTFLGRLFSTNDPHIRYASDYSSHIQGKYMQKFLNKRGAKSKKKWYQPHLAEPLEPISLKSASQKSGVSEAQRTRARQLSHVLYDKITHIVSTGELSQEIQDKQVFIPEVKMHPNFGGVNVYWDSERSDAHEVEKLLLNHAGKLRSLLISYHVLGKIPPIYFVKSKGKYAAEDLDKLLAEADYGPDYEPSHPAIRTKMQSLKEKNDLEKSHADPFHTLTEENTTAHNQRLSHAKTDDNKEDDDALSLKLKSLTLNFRNDLYGLPVDDLMNKIKAKKNRVRVENDTMESTLDSDHSKEERAKKLADLGKATSKLKTYKESSKVKQRRLERDPEDFLGSTDNSKDDYSY